MAYEWHTALTRLVPENRRALRRIAQYLDSYSLNEVVYEELMSDLVGMAQECEERKQPFSEAVGMDEVAFCRELVANCPRKTRAERALAAIGWHVAWMTAVLPVMMLLERIFPWMPGTIRGAVYFVPASFLCKYCVTVALIAGDLLFLKRNVYRSKSYVGGLYLLIFLAVYISVSELFHHFATTTVWTISLVAWLIAAAVLLTLVFAAKRCVAMTVAYQQKKQQLKEKNKYL